MQIYIKDKGEKEEKPISTHPWDLPTQISLLVGKRADHLYSVSHRLPSACFIFKLFYQDQEGCPFVIMKMGTWALAFSLTDSSARQAVLFLLILPSKPVRSQPCELAC